MSHEAYMRRCIELAQDAAINNEVPVGAVIVYNDEIIASASNAQIGHRDPTAHAEIICLRRAAENLQNYRLPGCTLYSTIEPCLMCAGALYWSQLGKLVYGAADLKKGFTKMNEKVLHPKTQVVNGILENESAELLRAFFEEKRR
ncbi:MAG: tRNA adenosine(34) deaminase TadA [Pseudomonadota bacterium]